MIVKAEDMARDVRVAIDMNRERDALLMEGDSETLELDDIIMSKLAEAVELVEMEAPLERLDNGKDFGECDTYIGADGKGYVILPGDFMRLVRFRMSDWHRSVSEAISEDDAEYAKQSSRWKGICGNPEKPVVAIVMRSEGRVLEFYSSRDAGARVVQATYIGRPRIDNEGGIEVARRCYRAAVYRAAALTLGSVGSELSGAMMEMSRALGG